LTLSKPSSVSRLSLNCLLSPRASIRQVVAPACPRSPGLDRTEAKPPLRQRDVLLRTPHGRPGRAASGCARCRPSRGRRWRAIIGEEVADVLLYLLQVADHCQIDVSQAVQDKLTRNAVKYPAKRAIPRVSPTRASVPGTHVLLDYENVQPSDAELRALVPDVGQVWVFHGPHQREVEKRFASFGTGATAVPISKTGKNALDFHLSFYMGYIASRNPDSKMVVVANDKGYEPMLEHAKAMGFVVRRQPHGEVKPPAKKAAAKKVVAKKSPAKKVAAKKAAAKKAAPKPADREASRQGAGVVAIGKEGVAAEGRACQEGASIHIGWGKGRGGWASCKCWPFRPLSRRAPWRPPESPSMKKRCPTPTSRGSPRTFASSESIAQRSRPRCGAC
jgi:hypothetical protein